MQQSALASQDMTSARPARSDAPDMVKVWDLPLRLTHWALAFSVLLAYLTAGKYDGLHRFAGYSVVALILVRLMLGFFGTRYSRFRALGRRLRASPAYLINLRHGATGRYRGLNPAGSAMLVAMLGLLAISTFTGWLSTTVRFFGVWWVEDTHGWVSDAVIMLVVIHIAGVLVMCVLQRENLVRSMITGWKRRTQTRRVP